MERVSLGRFMHAQTRGDKWALHNKSSGDLLGLLEYHPSWRQWVWETRAECIFSADCLQGIVKFLGRLNKERKEARDER